MMGETWAILIFANAKNLGGCIFVAGMNQLANNINVNPNMWPGMLTGTYARAIYIPNVVLSTLQTSASSNAAGFNFFIVLTQRTDWPMPGTVMGIPDSYAYSINGGAQSGFKFF